MVSSRHSRTVPGSRALTMSWKAMMRHAVEHPEEVRAKGARAREAMKAWSWDRAADVVEQRVEVCPIDLVLADDDC